MLISIRQIGIERQSMRVRCAIIYDAAYISARKIAVYALTYLFIDSVWVHRWWGCHRMSERSFRLQGRQLHVCARCTGLISGLLFSPLLFIICRHLPHAIFPLFTLCLALDGVTQMLGWRSSNNHLRFVTGFGTGMTFLSALLTLGGF